MKKCLLLWIQVLLLMVLCNGAVNRNSERATGWSAAEAGAAGREQTWIFQWKNEVESTFAEESIVTAYYPESNVIVAKPKKPEQQEKWLAKWSKSDAIAYIEPNQRYKIAKTPNDPLISNQNYLEQIHAEKAWDAATGNNSIVIALVDTGVELDHPDLKHNLVKGANLIRPAALPDDDNGHGTNVAGVIAAVANNDAGIAGLAWNAKIMPIKALESDGNGDEDKLGEGIRYAVDHGAKIVVLSLGLNKYSAYMEGIVHYAEDHGVLLVAASGNEGGTVKYPAAYDTVLGVGGVTDHNVPHNLSNSGPELDITAPWYVFTTAIEGNYNYADGTSMAAPQVAGVAALIWNKYPNMSPAEVRNLLRQTAQDLGPKGWDSQTGYGLLRADRALTNAPRSDIYEPNDRQADAARIPVNKKIHATFDPKDGDWFYVDTPYAGKLKLQASARSSAGLKISVFSDTKQERVLNEQLLSQGGAAVNVEKGRYYVKLDAPGLTETVAYDLSLHFEIYQDSFEDNDRQYKAYRLAARSQTITGTFDRYRDADWFSMEIDQPGTLKLKLTPDTARMDPVILVQKKGEKPQRFDERGDGQQENIKLDVTKGLYYFRVGNVANYPSPVAGEYTLNFDFWTLYPDANEPNNKPYQATVVQNEADYSGVFDNDGDTDWFKFKLDEESSIQLELQHLPDNCTVGLELYDGSLKPLDIHIQNRTEYSQSVETRLPAGNYYFKLSPNKDYPTILYSLKVKWNGQ